MRKQESGGGEEVVNGLLKGSEGRKTKEGYGEV